MQQKMESLQKWKNLLMIWVSRSFMWNSAEILEDTNFEAFARFCLQHINNSLVRPHVSWLKFVNEIYPLFEPNLNKMGLVLEEDYIFVYTLLLHYTCVLHPCAFFIDGMTKLSPDIRSSVQQFAMLTFKGIMGTRAELQDIISYLQLPDSLLVAPPLTDLHQHAGGEGELKPAVGPVVKSAIGLDESVAEVEESANEVDDSAEEEDEESDTVTEESDTETEEGVSTLSDSVGQVVESAIGLNESVAKVEESADEVDESAEEVDESEVEGSDTVTEESDTETEEGVSTLSDSVGQVVESAIGVDESAEEVDESEVEESTTVTEESDTETEESNTETEEAELKPFVYAEEESVAVQTDLSQIDLEEPVSTSSAKDAAFDETYSEEGTDVTSSDLYEGMRSRLKDKESELNASQEQVKQLKIEIDRKTEECETLQQFHNVMEKREKRRRLEENIMEANLKANKKEIRNKEEMITDMMHKLREMSSVEKDLEEKLAKETDINLEFETRITADENVIKKMKAAIRLLEKKLSNARAQVEKADVDNARLVQEIGSLNLDIAKQTSRNNQQEKSIESLKTDLQKLRFKLESQEETVKKLTNEMDSRDDKARKNIEMCYDYFTQLESRQKSMNSSFKGLMKDLQLKHTGDVQEYQKKLRELQTQLDNCGDKVTLMKSERDALQSERTIVLNKLGNAHTQIRRLNGCVYDLSINIKELKARPKKPAQLDARTQTMLSSTSTQNSTFGSTGTE